MSNLIDSSLKNDIHYPVYCIIERLKCDLWHAKVQTTLMKLLNRMAELSSEHLGN